MRVKNKFIAFSTKQIGISSLNQETCDSLIQSRIFINELLDKRCFSRFNNLKRIARDLGFKYTWHRGGRFLVKEVRQRTGFAAREGVPSHHARRSSHRAPPPAAYELEGMFTF